ncbi:snRNA-activating protein complex subunit 4 [Halotydeus destructor]|nr:snRNA-activating protein complex subunit 4 [Halotydeus destructor]
MECEEVFSQVDEGCDETAARESFVLTDLPVDLNSCLLLNQHYQVELLKLRQQLVSRLDENLFRHEELKSRILVKEEGPIPGCLPGNSHPNSLVLFHSPYFKDIRGFTAPLNEDAIKKQDNNELNQSYISSTPDWSAADKSKLSELVLHATIATKCKPLQAQKAKLIGNLSAYGDVDEINEDAIREKRVQLNEIERLIDDVWRESKIPSREECCSLDWLGIAVQLDSEHDWKACQLAWMNEYHPEITRTPWTCDEDRKLQSFFKELGNEWNLISDKLNSGRLAWQCASRYQSCFNSVTKRTGPLSLEERDLVDRVINQCRIGDYVPWHQVRYFIEGRTSTQIKLYWEKSNLRTLDDDWTELEDMVLVAAVEVFGVKAWKSVSNYVYGRNNRQCRERYMMRLIEGGRKSGNWTEEEDRELVTLSQKLDYKWSEIAKHVQGRNAKQLSGRYDLLMKLRFLNQAVGTEFDPQRHTRAMKNTEKSNESRISAMQKVKNFETKEELHKFLNEGKEKLQRELEHRLKAKAILDKKKEHLGAEKASKRTEEQAIDDEIIQMFMFQAMHQGEGAAKGFQRTAQDDTVAQTTETSLVSLLDGKVPSCENALSKVISLLLTNHVTSLPSTEKSTMASIFPPNRISVRSFQSILLQRDYLKRKVDSTGYELDNRMKISFLRNSHYRTLLRQFVGLFYWPAIMSAEEPPVKPKEQLKVGRKNVNKAQLKAERAANAAQIVYLRDSQKLLINCASSGISLLDAMMDARYRELFKPDQCIWLKRQFAFPSPPGSSPECGLKNSVSSQKSKKSSTPARKVVAQAKAKIVSSPRTSTRLAGKKSV